MFVATSGCRREGWLVLCLVVAAFASAFAGSEPPFARDLEVYDRLLAELKPEQARVRFGDIGMTPAQLREFRQRLVRLQQGEPLADAVTPAGTAFKWPGGNVFYRFDPVQVGSGTINAAKMQQFRDSIAEWAAFANLHFNEFTGTPPTNYITVRETPGLGGGFSSSVGMGGGEQTVELDPQAWNRGTICHEVGHAIGLWHEQQRPDRDTYVVINFSNIPPGQQGNFTIVPDGQVFGTAYDFYSVMHYRRDQFAINPNIDTISMQPGHAQFINIIGQVYDRTLSKIERAGMAAIYGVPAIAPSATVTNTKDSGAGSLRTAIYYAFDRSTDPVPVATPVTFHIPTSDPGYNMALGIFVIRPTFELVAPGGGTTIDGGTQTAFTGNTNPSGPEIMLDGSQIAAQNLDLFAAGFVVREMNCSIRNLIISGFNTQGIRFDGNLAATNGTMVAGNVVAGCYIGTDATGMFALGNGLNWPGIELFGTAHNNTIGGLTSSARNVISGNTGDGIRLVDSGTNSNVILGNYIGTNAAGTSALGNGFTGIAILGGVQNTTIGGTSAGARNVISGNQRQGVIIAQSGANGNVILGNYIGTNASGSAAIGNGQESNWAGVAIFGGAQNNTVGGTAPGAANVLSGNKAQGVLLAEAGTTGNLVQGNFIGTNPTGTAALPNQWSGIAIFGGAQSNTVGGLTSAARNVISGNGNQGIVVAEAGTSGNLIQGNFIGTDNTGQVALGNTWAGVSLFLGAQSNTIGGTFPGARNIISGNGNQGITLSDSGTNSNLVQGNYIGLDATGLVAMPNTYSGLDIFLGAHDNTIGGTTGGARNYISGNANAGMTISGSGSNNNLLQGNTIGLNIAGSIVGNAYQGVSIFGGASGNMIGGTAIGASNLIAGNGFEGIAVFDAATGNNAFRQNSIYANHFNGIGIYGNSNNNAVAPALTSAVLSPPGNESGTNVGGTLNSTPNTTFRIEFFSNPAGTGEGKRFIGSTNSLTNGSGTVSFGAALAAWMPASNMITATATDPNGNTSQFSNAVTLMVQDSDGDGTPDNWMNAHFGHPTGQAADLSRANDDADGDGLSNLQELFAGTDPRISSSALRITGTTKNATDVSFTFSSVAGRIYRIETRNDLISPNWFLFQDTIVATGASTQITDFGARALPHRFYRVLIEP